MAPNEFAISYIVLCSVFAIIWGIVNILIVSLLRIDTERCAKPTWKATRA